MSGHFQSKCICNMFTGGFEMDEMILMIIPFITRTNSPFQIISCKFCINMVKCFLQKISPILCPSPSLSFLFSINCLSVLETVECVFTRRRNIKSRDLSQVSMVPIKFLCYWGSFDKTRTKIGHNCLIQPCSGRSKKIIHTSFYLIYIYML